MVSLAAWNVVHIKYANHRMVTVSGLERNIDPVPLHTECWRYSLSSPKLGSCNIGNNGKCGHGKRILSRYRYTVVYNLSYEVEEEI